MGGCGVRVPLVKSNFHHCQRHTQIPAGQSANLRQIILFSFLATLGVRTAPILIGKEPVNYFPTTSKTRTKTVFMCGVAVLSSPCPSVSVGLKKRLAQTGSSLT